MNFTNQMLLKKLMPMKLMLLLLTLTNFKLKLFQMPQKQETLLILTTQN